MIGCHQDSNARPLKLIIKYYMYIYYPHLDFSCCFRMTIICYIAKWPLMILLVWFLLWLLVIKIFGVMINTLNNLFHYFCSEMSRRCRHDDEVDDDWSCPENGIAKHYKSYKGYFLAPILFVSSRILNI